LLIADGWSDSEMVCVLKKYAFMLKILIRKKQKKMACQAMLWLHASKDNKVLW